MEKCKRCGRQKRVFERFTSYGFCGSCNSYLRNFVQTRLTSINNVLTICGITNMNKDTNVIGGILRSINMALTQVDELEAIRPSAPFFKSDVSNFRAQLVALLDVWKKRYSFQVHSEKIIQHADNRFILKYEYKDVDIALPNTTYLSSLQLGTSLILEPEPNNEYDVKAIAICHSNNRLGYIHKGKLQDMIHDFTRRGEVVCALYTHEEPAQIHLAFYRLFDPDRCSKAIFKLVANKNEHMQDDLSLASVGEEVDFDLDLESDEERYLVSSSGLDLGYLSTSNAKKFAEEIVDENYFAEIFNLETDDNDKYIVSVIVYY